MKYTIIQDEHGDCNPRDWDNLGTMVCWHSQYNLGDEQAKSQAGLESLLPDDIAMILPLYLYDHSGITMSTGPFSCPWDSGQVGFIFVSRKTVLAEYGWKYITTSRYDKLRSYLESEVREYDQYLIGDVWGYEILDSKGEFLDSCWGFFGYDYCEQEAKSQLEYFQQQEQNKEAAELAGQFWSNFGELVELQAGQVGPV